MLTRRRLLHDATFGIGSVALAHLLRDDRLLAQPPHEGTFRAADDDDAPNRLCSARRMQQAAHGRNEHETPTSHALLLSETESEPAQHVAH